MKLRENPIYKLETRRWRSILPPGSIERRLAIAGIAVLLGVTIFAHVLPWLYYRASLEVQIATGYLLHPVWLIPGIHGIWNPVTGRGLQLLPEIATRPLADLYFPGNLVAGLAPALLLGRYMSRARKQDVLEQLMLTPLKAPQIGQGAVWAKILPVLPIIAICYGYFGVSPIGPLGPFFPHPGSRDHSADSIFLISLIATRLTLCAQAIACAYVALAVSARLAKTRFSLPVSLLLCALCIPAAAYSFGSGVAYRVWDWLNQHGWWTAPFMGAVWRCELLKICLIFVFYVALWWLAKGAAALEIERLMGTRRTRWRL